MLRGLSVRQFQEWLAYMDLEPIDERRADFRAASIVQALYNINRDVKRYPTPFKLDDFVLKFEDAPKQKQDVVTKLKLLAAMFTGKHVP